MSPERSALFESVQLGVEVTPGTSVSASKKLLATSFEISATPDVAIFRPNGYKFATIASLNREWTEASIDGQMSYTDLVYLFSSLISSDTPAVVGVTGSEWAFTSDSDGPDTPKTFTIEQGSSVRAHEFSHALVTALTLGFDNDGCTVSGSMIGTALTDGITMTATPTEIALQPVMRTEVLVYLADTAAGLDGATALTRVMSVEWSLGDRYVPVWALNGESSWDAFVESEPSGELMITMEADAAGNALFTQMRAGTTKFVRIEAIGPVIGAGPATYQLTIDTAIKITDVGGFSVDDELITIEWTGQFTHDSTWAKAFQITVTNALTAL